MMLNAKNARPFDDRRGKYTMPTLPDGWTLVGCIMAGGTYDGWEVITDKGQRDVLFTKRTKK